MTTAYETLSKEEANSFFFGGQPPMAPQQIAPQQTAPQQAAPADTSPRKAKPVAPPAMGKIDAEALTSQVGQANKAIQAQTPAPQAPSVVGALMDQILNNWQLPALGLGALAAAGYVGYKAGSGPKEGLKSRDIMNRVEPTMDGSDLSKATPTAAPVAPVEKPAPKGPKKEPAVVTFKTAKDIPEGFVFRPDVGNLDRSLGNILGLEHRANAREMFSGGKPFGQFKGTGPTAFNDEISRLTTNYFQKLQSEIPETILSRDARKAQGIPSDFGTYATKTNFGKAAKVAGVAGTLIAVADIANAAQKGNIGEAALRSADLATDYIPGVAQFKQGLSPFEASAPTLGEKQLKAFENAQKLGSPYRSVPPR